jgi:uncharacterized protein (DUF2147 family)
MRNIILATLLASFAFATSAQQHATSPVGKWKTLDDKTGKVTSITEVYSAQNNTLAAKIVETVGGKTICEECSGQYKGKPLVGIAVLWNLKANNDGTWGGGSGYKPSEDRNFNAKSVKLIDGGKKLEVKGCVAFICRTATWVRAD